MIGNRYAVEGTGFTVLEEGEINRQTLQLDVRHYLVCQPDGDVLAQTFSDRAAAEEYALALASRVSD